MQVKEGFLLRKVGVQYIVAPTGDLSKEFNGMIRLNDTGSFLFEQLMKETTQEKLVEALTIEYDVERNQAEHDVEGFVRILQDASLMKGGDSI